MLQMIINGHTVVLRKVNSFDRPLTKTMAYVAEVRDSPEIKAFGNSECDALGNLLLTYHDLLHTSLESAR